MGRGGARDPLILTEREPRCGCQPDPAARRVPCNIMANIIALVDCNNFYVSCERVFAPRLDNRPVIVMSNNDGCVVSRSDEAKALGIGMGQPVFQVRNLLHRHDVAVCSSNYALYGDMSRRVMATLGHFTPDFEVYSIDEAFLLLSVFRDSNPTVCGREIQTTVRRWTGIPVSVGIAPTKTLAKLANRLAKRSARTGGVLDLTQSPYLDRALASTPVECVWGVGPKFSHRLRTAGIDNALQLRDADDRWIRRVRGVMGARTVLELRGVVCFTLEQSPPPRQSIAHTRTFSRRICTLAELREAAAAYATRAAEKLRRQRRAAGVVTVFVMTNLFESRSRRYFNARTYELPTPTSSTATIVKLATSAVEEIFRAGFAYKKAGVLLDSLVSDLQVPAALFPTREVPAERPLMHLVDALNERFSSGIVSWAAAGFERSWQVKFRHRSPRYTTRWRELPVVKASGRETTSG